jgi:hypothetical protein
MAGCQRSVNAMAEYDYATGKIQIRVRFRSGSIRVRQCHLRIRSESFALQVDGVNDSDNRRVNR